MAKSKVKKSGKYYRIKHITTHDSHDLLTDGEGRKLLRFEMATSAEKDAVLTALNS